MSATAWPSCLSISRHPCTLCSALAPTPTCHWPDGAYAASWPRSAPPTCGSRPTEAGSYLNEAAGLQLTAGDVETLEERTEGWIAALQLAALSLQGREDVSGFIARFAGNDRYIVDYLVEEVLEQQPEPVRDFLLQSAVLDRLTGPLCDAVTGRDDGTPDAHDPGARQPVPRRLWTTGGSGTAITISSPTCCGRACSASSRTQVPLLHQRASQWYERHDLAEEAVRHALGGAGLRPRGPPDRAGGAADPASPAGSDDVRLAEGAAGRRRPAQPGAQCLLRIHAAWSPATSTRSSRGSTTRNARWRPVPDGSVLPWADTDDLHTLPATIAIYRASLAQARGDAAGTAEHAQRALDLAGPDDHLARGGAGGFLGLAAWAQGDVASALETFTQAVASLHAAGNLVDELSGTVVLADLWLAAGRPSKARRLCARALQLAEAHGARVARATAELHVGLSEIDVEAGDLESAKRHLETAAALAHRAAMTESRYRWFVAMGTARPSRRRPGWGRPTCLDQAEQLYRPGFFPDVRPIAAMKARVWIAQGSCRRNRRLGAGTRRVRHRRGQLSAASSTTSPWSGC